MLSVVVRKETARLYKVNVKETAAGRRTVKEAVE
jgi:hypothetical protein